MLSPPPCTVYCHHAAALSRDSLLNRIHLPSFQPNQKDVECLTQIARYLASGVLLSVCLIHSPHMNMSLILTMPPLQPRTRVPSRGEVRSRSRPSSRANSRMSMTMAAHSPYHAPPRRSPATGPGLDGRRSAGDGRRSSASTEFRPILSREEEALTQAADLRFLCHDLPYKVGAMYLCHVHTSCSLLLICVTFSVF